MNNSCHRRIHKHREGAALIVVVAMTMVFLIMAAISINVAYMQLSRMQLRAAADAASQAGAVTLLREQSLDAARQRTKEVAAMNIVGGQPLLLRDQDIQFGRSERNKGGRWKFIENTPPFTTVRISAEKKVGLFFSGILGHDSFTPSLSSAATFADNEVVLVMDRSHSMCYDFTGVRFSYPQGFDLPRSDPATYMADPFNSRWAGLEQATEAFLDELGTRDSGQRVGMVSFGSEKGTDSDEYGVLNQTFPAVTIETPLTTDTTQIKSSLSVIGESSLAGATNLGAGMEAAIDMLTSPEAHPFSKKTMIVFTDGLWNDGDDPVKIAQDARKAKITVHTITLFVTDTNDMEKVAQRGGGQHYSAFDRETLIAVFRDLARSIPVSLTE